MDSINTVLGIDFHDVHPEKKSNFVGIKTITNLLASSPGVSLCFHIIIKINKLL